VSSHRGLTPRKRAELERTIAHLEEYLEGDAWPSGLALTIEDRAVIRRNLEHMRAELERG
jgi:hypothetical protein